MENRRDFSKHSSRRQPCNIRVEEERIYSNVNVVESTTPGGWHRDVNSYQKRVTIKYRIGDSTTDAELRTCEVDALSLFSLLSTSKRLFTVLEETGLSSPLLHHFATCEKTSLSENPTYTLPGTERTIFVANRAFQPDTNAQKYKEASEEKRPELLNTSYKLSGGMDTIQVIATKDPIFFHTLYMAIIQNLCSISQLDLCADYQQDMMQLVSDSVKKGRVHSFGAHLSGYGPISGKHFEKAFLGRRGAFYKRFSRKDCKFTLETLYCGSRRSHPISFCFYDKRAQSSRVEHQEHLDSTRIEVRLHVKKDKNCHGIALTLFKSLFLENGRFLRHIIFTWILFSRINFSTTVRKQKKGSNPSKNKNNSWAGHSWAGWWQNLFKVYTSVLGEQQQISENFLNDLAKMRANPKEALPLLVKQIKQITDQGVNLPFNEKLLSLPQPSTSITEIPSYLAEEAEKGKERTTLSFA